MHILRGHQDAGTLARGGAVALGNFDGVHRGHQVLVQRAVEHARKLGGPALAFTFEPHPTRVLAPALAPPLIVPLEHRLDLLEELGLDAVVLEPFTPELAKTPAEDFVRNVLVGALGIKAAVVGYNFTFGHARKGNPELLTRLGAELGFLVDVVNPVDVNGMLCSSTKIRELVLEGNVEGAAILLGRPFSVRGVVVHGNHRGRLLGFPTANVSAPVELLPRLGVYVAQVVLRDVEARPAHPAVVNVGVSPTFGGGPVTVEAHLLDFTGDLYGQRLEVRFLRRLRDEKRFAGVEQLKAQIEQDVAYARRFLSGG
ncbi:MAG: bifunctional riboflavin kinase/FAD synthetase [Myxococcota bacterium]